MSGSAVKLSLAELRQQLEREQQQEQDLAVQLAQLRLHREALVQQSPAPLDPAALATLHCAVAAKLSSPQQQLRPIRHFRDALAAAPAEEQPGAALRLAQRLAACEAPSALAEAAGLFAAAQPLPPELQGEALALLRKLARRAAAAGAAAALPPECAAHAASLLRALGRLPGEESAAGLRALGALQRARGCCHAATLRATLALAAAAAASACQAAKARALGLYAAALESGACDATAALGVALARAALLHSMGRAQEAAAAHWEALRWWWASGGGEGAAASAGPTHALYLALLAARAQQLGLPPAALADDAEAALLAQAAQGAAALARQALPAELLARLPRLAPLPPPLTQWVLSEHLTCLV